MTAEEDSHEPQDLPLSDSDGLVGEESAETKDSGIEDGNNVNHTMVDDPKLTDMNELGEFPVPGDVDVDDAIITTAHVSALVSGGAEKKQRQPTQTKRKMDEAKTSQSKRKNVHHDDAVELPPSHHAETSVSTQPDNQYTPFQQPLDYQPQQDHNQLSPISPLLVSIDTAAQHTSVISIVNKQIEVQELPDYSHFAPPPSLSAIAASPSAASYSRKDKALGLLAQRLIHMYQNPEAGPQSPNNSHVVSLPPLLSVDKTAAHLSVERRRIYDIVNILEALDVVSKKCKNMYWWHGLEVLETTFKNIQMHAITSEEFRLDAEKNGMRPTNKVDDGAKNNHIEESDSSQSYLLSVKAALESESNKKKSNKKVTPEKNSFGSLGQLTKKFISLYMIGYDALSLGEATERLLGFEVESNENDDVGFESMSTTHRKRETEVKGWKTKVRRLYDIANVLSSMGIIDKTTTPLSHQKCGNMLMGDGKTAQAHFHKNNQYFYWNFPKTPQEMLAEQLNFYHAGSKIVMATDDKSENNNKTILHDDRQQVSNELKDPSNTPVQEPDDKVSNTGPDVYEI